MCSIDAPEPVVQEVKKPTFVRNDYLDSLNEDQRKVGALRTGRSALVVAKPGDVGFSGRNATGSQGGVAFSSGNTVGASVSTTGDRTVLTGGNVTDSGSGTGVFRSKRRASRRRRRNQGDKG